MKRHPDLRRFSDDHHQGLVQARRLRRAAAGEQPLDAAQGFLRFWREHTREHTSGKRKKSCCRCLRVTEAASKKNL